MGSLVSSKSGVSLTRHVAAFDFYGSHYIEAIALSIRMAGSSWLAIINQFLIVVSVIQCTSDKGSSGGIGGC